MRKKPKFIRWAFYAEIEKAQDPMTNVSTSGDDYLLIKEAPLDEEHNDVLTQELVRNKYIICGDTHQDSAIPVFDDGYLLLSMRKWAEIMDDAAMLINPVAYFKGNYSSTSFYMACVGAVKENLPVLDER